MGRRMQSPQYLGILVGHRIDQFIVERRVFPLD